MSGMHMGLGMRQDQRMIQTIAPRMIQSMEILQLPIMALQERIEQELEENPVLELRETAPAESPELAPGAAPEGEFNPDGILKHDETGDLEFARMDELNRDWDDHFDSEHRPSRSMAEELSTIPNPLKTKLPARRRRLRRQNPLRECSVSLRAPSEAN